VVYVCKTKEYVCVSFGCYACNIRKCESRKIKKHSITLWQSKGGNNGNLGMASTPKPLFFGVCLVIIYYLVSMVVLLGEL